MQGRLRAGAKPFGLCPKSENGSRRDSGGADNRSGDNVADRREELVQKFGFIGNAADIHGCFITPTGRIAWCDGRHGHGLCRALQGA